MELLDDLVEVLLGMRRRRGDDIGREARGVVEVGDVALLDEGERDGTAVVCEQAAVDGIAVDDGTDLGHRLEDGDREVDVVVGGRDVVDKVAVEVDHGHVGAMVVVDLADADEAGLDAGHDDAALAVDDGDLGEAVGVHVALVEETMHAAGHLVLIQFDAIGVDAIGHITTFHSVPARQCSRGSGLPGSFPS